VESKWRIKLTPAAEAGLEQILRLFGGSAYREALDEILALKEDPTPPESVHLRKTKAEYRIRLYRSMYRAIYQVSIGQQLVIVTRVGPRGGGIYRGYEKW
jgi:mRNA-degrading endonuclease RelE of RelBE toxin-antitoxin system